jgi:hypothetical protein
VPGGPSLDHNLQLAVKPGHLCLSQKKRYIYIYKKRRVPGALLRGHNLQLAVNPGHLCRSQKKRNIYIKKEACAGRVPGGPSPGPQLATGCQPWPLMCLRVV